MFNKIIDEDEIAGTPKLAFVKSASIKVYPCSRRRTDPEGSAIIPFDPEARLNTEANNIKRSSANGTAATYVRKYSDSKLFLVLDGYNFEIDLDSGYAFLSTSGESAFATGTTGTTGTPGLLGSLSATDATKIYANIRLEEVPLYSGDGLNYTTWILRNQSEGDAKTYLDLLNSATDSLDNYYFSGLSFSVSPLTNNVEKIVSETAGPTTNSQGQAVNQKLVSLCILEKVGDSWIIPGQPWAVTLEAKALADNKYQLQFTSGKINN